MPLVEYVSREILRNSDTSFSLSFLSDSSFERVKETLISISLLSDNKD